LRSSWKFILLGLAALLVAATGQRAQAQTTGLANSNSLTYDGLTYTVSACVFVLAGTAQSSCSSANAELQVVGTGSHASIEVLNVTPGAALMSLASTAGNTYSDLTFDVTVTAPSSSRTVNGASIAETGTGVAGYATQVTSSATIGIPGTNFSSNMTSLTSPSAAVSFAPFNPTVTAPLTFNVDLKVSTMPGTGGNKGTITLNNTLLHAPEPASIALFGTALTGLAAIRRRRKQKTAAKA